MHNNLCRLALIYIPMFKTRHYLGKWSAVLQQQLSETAINRLHLALNTVHSFSQYEVCVSN